VGVVNCVKFKQKVTILNYTTYLFQKEKINYRKIRMKNNLIINEFLTLISIVSFGAAPWADVMAMPQTRIGPNNPVGGFRPLSNEGGGRPATPNEGRRNPRPEAARRNPANGRRNPNARPRTLSPAYPAPELYLAPQFDEFGAPLPPEDLEYDYNDDIFDEVDDIPAEPLRDFGSGSGLIPTNFRGEPNKPRLPRPPNSNLGPDLQPRLPNFDILRATEVLRSRDQNQKSLVSPGVVNAGILPLAFENPNSDLGLFPPLANP